VIAVFSKLVFLLKLNHGKSKQALDDLLAICMNLISCKLGIGESLLTSLFTFLDLPNRSRGRIYEINAKVERADQVEQFVQFSALCKQY